MFNFLKDNPKQGKIFNEAMSCISSLIEIPVIVNIIQWSGITMDMGGGTGTLLAAILEKYPTVFGILFDLPEVINDTAHLPSVIVDKKRCDLVGGSFFNKTTIPCADNIILKRVLHDWDNETTVTILKNCADKIKENNGHIFIFEYLANSALMSTLDLLMMAIGGEARLPDTFKTLCQKAGLEFKGVKAITPMLSVIQMSQP